MWSYWYVLSWEILLFLCVSCNVTGEIICTEIKKKEKEQLTSSSVFRPPLENIFSVSPIHTTEGCNCLAT